MENDLLAIIDIFKQCQEIEITDENSDTDKGLFYMEKQYELNFKLSEHQK